MDKKQELITRIENLTEEQFEQLIHLWELSNQESVPDDPIPHPTFHLAFV